MISIVCDSTVYMTAKEAEQLGVNIVPVSYYTPEKSYDETYIDKTANRNDNKQAKLQTNHTNIAVF